MGKVRLEISPTLAGLLNMDKSDWIIVQKEIEESATIGDLLTDLAFTYSAFRTAVFEPNIGKVSDQVIFVLNGTNIPASDVTQVKAKDGDVIVLVPIYSGG